MTTTPMTTERENETKLLPCPFCGSQVRQSGFPRHSGRIGCENDDCFGPFTTAEGEDAVVQWNNRSPAPTGDGEAGKLADTAKWFADKIEGGARLFEKPTARPGVMDCTPPIDMAQIVLYASDMRSLIKTLREMAALRRALPPQPTGDAEGFTTEDAIKWLDEAARYFAKRDTKGEDMAFWANVYNAENCEKIAALLRSADSRLAASEPPESECCREGVESPCGPFVDLERELESSKARVAELENTIRETQCPRPANSAPDDTTVEQCIARKECGCCYGAALSTVAGEEKR